MNTLAPARDGNTGQISLGEGTKRLSPGEAGFREGGGIPGLSCGNCRFFVGGGIADQAGPVCFMVEVTPDPEDYCDQFEPAINDGNRPSASGQTLQMLSRADMFITRVDERLGKKRWYATSSGVKRDAYGEWMTVDLFRDFIHRIRINEPAPEIFTSKAWRGGNPYLGVAHYLDMDGIGIIGDTERVYIDGANLKARGTFRGTPIAQAAFTAIQRDIQAEVAPSQRVRISIAFVDYGHDHSGIGAFERKSLSDRCAHCERGAGEKHYKKGVLVHLALTRNPAYPETEIALQERSMSSKRDDAATIIGEDMADELEKKAKGLTERANVDPKAMVIKAEDGAVSPPAAPAAGEPMLAQPMGEQGTGTAPMEMMSKGFLGGAKTLAEADAFLGRSGAPVLLDSYGVLSAVLTNIAGTEHANPIKAALAEFQTGVDQATVRTLNDVAKYITAKGENEVTETPLTPEVPEVVSAPVTPTEPAVTPPAEAPSATEPVVEAAAAVAVHPLDGPISALKQTYDHALASALAPEDRLSLMQTPYDALQDAVMRAFSEPTAAAAPVAGIVPMTREEIVGLMAQQVAPLAAEMRAIAAAIAPLAARAAAPRPGTPVPPSPTPRVGQERRAFRLVPRSQNAPGGGLVPFGEPPKKPSGIRALARRSVGIVE